MDRDLVRLRRLLTAELTDRDVLALRRLLWAAFADDGQGFTEEDWAHALGGVHVVLDMGDEVVAHASVVERELHVGDRPLRTGYVEAVATDRRHEGRGFGSRVMAEIGSSIRAEYELGALSTGRPSFYERLGWRRWVGRTFVRTEQGIVNTPDDDGTVLVLATPTTPNLDLSAAISCEWRPGDVW